MSSPRLPVFVNVARVALWGGSLFEVAGGDLQRFILAEGCIAVSCCFLRSQDGFEYVMPGCGSWRGEQMSGVIGSQG